MSTVHPSLRIAELISPPFHIGVDLCSSSMLWDGHLSPTQSQVWGLETQFRRLTIRSERIWLFRCSRTSVSCRPLKWPSESMRRWKSLQAMIAAKSGHGLRQWQYHNSGCEGPIDIYRWSNWQQVPVRRSVTAQSKVCHSRIMKHATVMEGEMSGRKLIKFEISGLVVAGVNDAAQFPHQHNAVKQ